jgi:Domain of unknown function (DUF4279)
MAETADLFAERSHYHFRISLRVRHPYVDPAEITKTLAFEPSRFWRGGETRRTRAGRPLSGLSRDTYWTADISAGRWPNGIDGAIQNCLQRLTPFRSFFLKIRADGGAVELFVGWFFENQSGDTLSHRCLALAGDLQIDLSFDVYPPDQPQNEYEVGGDVLRRA